MMPKLNRTAGEANHRSMGLLTGKLHELNQCMMIKGGTDKKIELRSYVDSGAARSVCGRTFGAQFGLEKTASAARGDGFQTATGKKVSSLGGRTIRGTTASGEEVSMQYAVADIAVALDSVSQICDSGATVTFTATGGRIERSGQPTIEFPRVGDTYMRTVLVDKEPSFTRPGP